MRPSRKWAVIFIPLRPLWTYAQTVARPVRKVSHGQGWRPRIAFALSLTSSIRHLARAACLGRSGSRADQRTDEILLSSRPPSRWSEVQAQPPCRHLRPHEILVIEELQVPDRMII